MELISSLVSCVIMFVDLEVREFNGFSARCNRNVKTCQSFSEIKLQENETNEIN